MNINNIREIIFCNKNGRPTAFAKEYGNKFTEMSLEEAINLAKEIEYRILTSREDIDKLQKEIAYNPNKKTSKLGLAAAAIATAGVLVFSTGAGSVVTGNTTDTGAAQITSGVAYAEETPTQEAISSQVEFDSLLSASQSPVQRETVQMMSDYIDYFNVDFANNYVETVQLRDSEGNLTGEEIEVKPALLWDYEVPALTIAYNDYTTRELQEIFNGTELDAYTLDANYKNGTLQLFGAYVISDREHPVNLSALIESPEGQAFVQKYEDLFYNIKEAKTEEEQIAAVNAFYAELYRDFPIDSYSREVGISHADSRSLMLDQPYKLAITPMIAATEVMYQNLAIDHTLSDGAIAYFNDLGLCNLAYSSFEKAERALESVQYDEAYADYEKLSQLKINSLRQAGNYVIDDIHRDLSLLTKFQENVNGHFEVIDGEWVYNGDSAILSTTVETYQEIVDQWSTSTTETWTETSRTETSDRGEAISRAGRELVEAAEREVDNQIDQENADARARAEQEADAEQARQQREEDQHASQVRDEVAQDAQDMQDQIDHANDTINHGGTVNESDFGDHGVDFDDNHSDENGNLDNSVEDITLDGTGAHDASDPLPDPNETGRAFDARYQSSFQSSTTTTQSTESYSEQIETEVSTEYSEPTTPVVESTPEVQQSTPVVEEPQVVESTPVQVETTPVVESTPEPDPVVESQPVATVDYSDEDEEAVYYNFEDIDYEEEFTSSSDSDLEAAHINLLMDQPTSRSRSR